MKRFRTLRARFALWTAGLFLIVLAVFGVYVYVAMARGLYTALDNSLALNASQVIASLNVENGRLIPTDSLAEPPEYASENDQGTIIRVVSLDGKLLQTSGPPVSLPLPEKTNTRSPSILTWTDPASNDTLRVYSAPVTDNNILLAVAQVARSPDNEQETLQQLLMTLLLGIPMLVAAAGLSGYFLAARALSPIDTITRTARRISAEDLSARLDLPATDDEVGRLAETFDAMLARLDGAFQRERQFTADASHELRTPLAAMEAILSVIREERRSPEDYELALDDLTEETNRLRALTEELLQLARGENRQIAIRQNVDLTTLLQDIGDSLRPLAESKGLALDFAVSDDLTLSGDSDALIRLFVNLLDNAIKYTPQGSITLAAGRGPGGIIKITIADTGMGISAEHLPHIFDRFYRVDKSRTSGGAGLGLAIASEIVRAHRGTIEVTSRLGEGSNFILCFPLLPGATKSI
ncbi:MAG: ATP-binding protein [Bellilinea sp.]